MNQITQQISVLAQAGARGVGGVGLALLAALLGMVSSATAAEAALTTTELSQTMRDVVSELSKIPGAAGEVLTKVQQLQSEAESHFQQSTNSALSSTERNRHYALALGGVAKAVIEADKFAQFKGRIISSVKGRLASIQGSVDGLNPIKLPPIDFKALAAQNVQADKILAEVLGEEAVSQDQVEALLMAKGAASDVDGLSNDSLGKFQGDLKELWHQVVGEEFKVAQSTVVNRRVLTWIQIKAMQGQLGLACNSSSVPGFNAKDVAASTKTLITFSPPRETGGGGAFADTKPRRVAAASALLQ